MKCLPGAGRDRVCTEAAGNAQGFCAALWERWEIRGR